MTANTVHAAQNLVFNPFLFMKLFNLLSQTCMTWNYIFLIEAAMCPWLSCDLAYLDHFDFNAFLGPRGLDAYCDWIHNGAPESNLELDTSQRDNLADAMPLKAAMKKKDEKGRAWIANSWLSDSNFFFLCWTMRLFFSKRGTWGNFRWSLREWYMCWRWWDEIFIYWLWHTYF